MPDTREFVAVAIAKKISEIEPRARRLGWPSDRLFAPNLDDNHGRPQGLASVLEPSDAIIAVRRDCIMIRKNRVHVLRFPRS